MEMRKGVLSLYLEHGCSHMTHEGARRLFMNLDKGGIFRSDLRPTFPFALSCVVGSAYVFAVVL